MDNQNANPKQQLLEKLRSSTNILVTVSSNPSVDQLAACLGLTLWLNKVGKHATAVFSGNVPSTLEFLQPEDTLEKNTDSLRDFIISLDKSKADKLRYKVEDRVVKIFITPYRTNLSADDLEFSQGDFNVDMVVAIGVTAQEDLDTAITAHGRILHDAAVTTVTTNPASQLGSINWNDGQASSLSELVVDLGNELDRTMLDGQIATALLTGIVAETARFSNDKTTPQTMSISAELMSAGANQQLVASQLDQPVTTIDHPDTSDDHSDQSTDAAAAELAKSEDGTIEIEHPGDLADEVAQNQPGDTQNDDQPLADLPSDVPFEEQPVPEAAASESEATTSGSKRLITDAPTLGGTLTANSRPDDAVFDPVTDPLSMSSGNSEQPLLDRHLSQPTLPPQPLQPAPPDWLSPAPAEPLPATELPAMPPQPAPDDTLSHIEATVDSPHLQAAPPELDDARDEVIRAINAVPDTSPEPIQALNAQSIDLGPPATELPPTQPQPLPTPSSDVPAMPDPTPDPLAADMSSPVSQALTMPLPPVVTPTSPTLVPTTPTFAPSTPTVIDPNAPPPVPPPLVPPFPQ